MADGDARLARRMEELGIDVARSREILDRLNNGGYDGVEPVRVSGIPEVDNAVVFDRTREAPLRIADDSYRARLESVAPEIDPGPIGAMDGGTRILEPADLERLGVLLYPRVSYGVLNGGSATSYVDERKNRSLDAELFELFRREFETVQEIVAGRPKGITPAYLNPDGTPGASYLELKFRMLHRHAARYRHSGAAVPPEGLEPLTPVLEMTSLFTEDAIRSAYGAYEASPLLRDLSDTGRILDTLFRPQPLLATLSNSGDGLPRRFFTGAYGRSGEPLGLPGGHGQNFHVLAAHYRRLAAMGKRFVYLGNVDNLGFTVDPIGIARLALSGAPAAFDFAFRTPVDVKGGVLVFDQSGGLNCADIGAAISPDEVIAAEDRGATILFNCATGLFSLDWLVGNLDRVIADLPMRISDQDKDAGRYAQAEQVTWEIIGMMESPLIFGIDKYRRFLPAKMLLDTFLSSGLRAAEAARIQPTAARLADGFARVMRAEYGMDLVDRRWTPAD